ncbi:hypothetical protein CYOG_00024 [Cyanophage 9515-10a]|uniref:Predicted protein n=1 Tax=Cyanophage 9515-10a TaxID=444875 RepID=E3SMF0_9CAUD|nr:hypothetical protein CYOG_00024 [Cyanophage 9515-10a]ADP00045.1 predicted protein [Cyanophage 9515-10a]
MAEAKVSVSDDTKKAVKKKEPKIKVKVPGKLSEKATRGTLDKR